MKIRVIYTPDEREFSSPKLEIIEARTIGHALVALAEAHDIELDHDDKILTVEYGLTKKIIDRLKQEDFNLSYLATENLVILDDIFEPANI